MRITRRSALTFLGAGASFGLDKPEIDAGLVRRHDESIDRGLAAQVTDPASRGYGCLPNAHGIFNPEPAAGWIEACTAAYLYPGSRFHKSTLLFERIKLAAAFLTRTQHPDGLVDYLDTNFDSAPDAGFTLWSVGTAACLAQRHGERELLALIEPFLRKAAAGLAIGGIHTPNHRWVVSSALAQVNEVFPDPSYVRRIDQWLAEGIDLDADGQFTERSTTVYNPICDRAFLVMAAKLKRPELLAPVRANLESMLYLLYSDFEVVTNISRRQDQNVRGNMSGYWFPLRYLAIKDGNGQFAAIANRYTDTAANLSTLMEYPEMLGSLPPSIPPPDNYTHEMNSLGIVRFRRGPESSTLLAGQPTFFATRSGGAVIEAVRFATAFFGKGQFVAPTIEKQGGRYILRQHLEAGYYQPLDPPQRVTSANWGELRAKRRRTQNCVLEHVAELAQIPTGYRLRIRASGTAGVPLAIEINLREGGKLQGCDEILSSGYATYSTPDASLRFGPGIGQHRWTQLRGALPKLPGRSVYLTGFTPFDHTLEILTA
jgi:hypothetical protein